MKDCIFPKNISLILTLKLRSIEARTFSSSRCQFIFEFLEIKFRFKKQRMS